MTGSNGSGDQGLAAAFGPGSIAVGVAAADWREAVAAAADLLVASGRVEPSYGAACIEAVERLGPYIVIAPGIALAHAKPTTAMTHSPGLSLAVLAEPVEFGNRANDPVRLVFALAATDHDSHIELMSAFAERMGDQDCVNSLLNARSAEEIRTLLS